MICPSCLMFDAHKGHIVARIEDGARDLRTRINAAARDGTLQFQRTEGVLLDIRHSRLSLQQNAHRILSQAEAYFDELATAIKTRRTCFMDELRGYFNAQLEELNKKESEWMERQGISEHILKLQACTDDNKMLEQAVDIVKGLQTLAQPPCNFELHLLNTVQNQFSLAKHKYPFADIIGGLKECLAKGKETIHRIKC